MLKHFISSALAHYLKAPLTTLVNLLALALGLACFFGALGVSSHWGQSDASFENRDRIRILTQQFDGDGGEMRLNPMVADPVATYIREDVPSLEAVARLRSSEPVTFLRDGQPYQLDTAYAHSELFDVFDFDFVHGSADDVKRTPGGLVMMASVAQRVFGDANPVGSSFQIGDDSLPVTAVIQDPPQPSHLGAADGALRSFEVLQTQPASAETVGDWWLGVTGYTYVLLPEDGTAQAEAALDSALSDLAERRIPDAQRNALERIWFSHISLGELQSRYLDGQIFRDSRNALSVTRILFGLGILILIVSIINYSNLATAQAAGYAKEVGMRKVVGASQLSIALQYWLEALILTLFALMIAMGLIGLAAPVLKAQTGIDVLSSLARNPGLMGWALGLVLIVSVLASIYPVAYLARIRPVEALRTGRVRGGNRRMTEILVGAQFAAASALLILVFIVGQQNSYMRSLVLQPDEDPVAVLEDLSVGDRTADDYRAALDRYPSLTSVTHINYMPWSDYVNYMTLSPTRKAGGLEATSTRSDIGYDFFETNQATLLAGRVFDPDRDQYWNDYPEGYTGDLPIIIDWTHAKALGFASPEAAIDQTVFLSRTLTEMFQADPTYRIIGVVETVPMVYGVGKTQSNFYALHEHDDAMNLMVRINRNRIEQGLADIEAMVTSRDPNAVVNIRFTDAEFERNFQTYSGINIGFMGLSLIAFSIATIGLFAMAVFTTLQRRQEIGIRKTLGASTADVTRQLIREFTWPVLIANLLAWPIAFYAARIYLENFMQRVDLTPLPWVLGLVVTLMIAWISVGGQAYRAARVKPALVLKDE